MTAGEFELPQHETASMQPFDSLPIAVPALDINGNMQFAETIQMNLENQSLSGLVLADQNSLSSSM